MLELGLPGRAWPIHTDGPYRKAFQAQTLIMLCCSLCGIRYEDPDSESNVFDTIAEVVTAAHRDGWTTTTAPVVDGPTIHATYAVCDLGNVPHRKARAVLMPPTPYLNFGSDGQEPLPGMEFL